MDHPAMPHPDPTDMMRAIAKRRLRFGAVEALVSLQAQGQSCWTDTLTLLSHYLGW